MKKIYFAFLCAACAFTLFSCQKENNGPEESPVPDGYVRMTLKAVSDETKTTVDGTTVKWAKDDQIKVYYSNGEAVDFTLVGDGGSASGEFDGTAPVGATALYAVYPTDLYASVSETTVNVTIPDDSQDGVFGKGNIAVAKVNGDKMSFKNVNAFVGFTVPAGATKVVVSSVGGQNLAGTLAVDCSEENPTAGALSSGSSSITVTFPVSTGDTYYVAVAPGVELTKGLLLTWYNGEDVTGTYWLNKAVTTASGSIINMETVSTDGNYYVSVNGVGKKNGMNADNAWSAAQFWSKLHPGGTDTKMDGAKLANINGATFHLAEGTYNWGTDAEININETETISFTIKGESGTIFTGDDDDDDAGDHRILSLGGNMNVTFEGISFENGKVTDGNGGALNISAGQWTFTSCTFSGNEASGNGGAINLSGGSATIYKSTFNRNEATGNGGAINVAEGAKIEVLKAQANTQFTNNEATGNGGAVNVESKNNSISNRINNADFKRNSANNGGAIAVRGGSDADTTKLVFSNCTMGTMSSDGNTASYRGGAIFLDNAFYTNVGNSTMKYNSASNNGGAIAIEGWGRLELFRSYFYSNSANSGGVVYTQAKEGASSKCSEFFVDGCSFEANYINDRWGCIFNVNDIKQFSMYNSSAKDSYTKSKKQTTGEYPSWIAIDKVQNGGSVSFGNCSIIGDTWDGNNNVALTTNTALIFIWGTQTNYFTNCIIVPDTDSSIAAIRGNGDEVINLYYTHYSSIGNTATPINSGGSVAARQKSNFDGMSWNSNCWKWNGPISSAAPTKATKKGVYDRINGICPAFVTWSDTDFVKDQLGNSRGANDGDYWWPGAYQN